MSDIDALTEIIAGLEARVIRLEKRNGVKAPPAPWVPREGSAIGTILNAVVVRGGIWSPDRAMDVLTAAGWDSDSETPISVTSFALRRLVEEGYLTHPGRGRYRYTGKALPAGMTQSS